ncbi:MAG: group II intron reverse transcriptase domain-containing protein [FCB group bacterium]|nr:group II intron reverse transcriptase domain-containing protein [FCB group bacterium]
MKSIRNVFDHICSFENLLVAFQKARRGKQYREYAVDFENRLEENLLELAEELKTGAYFPGDYRTFYIREPKRRLISAAPFRDRVVHHAVIGVIEPYFDKKLIEDTYACRKGKGTHKALDRCQYFLRRFDWALKCDVRKYFPSIDHLILLEQLRKYIEDEKTLGLLEKIVVHSNEQEFVIAWFPGDDLLTPLERRRGIPIGNLTSQFFANFYLNGFDHFIKQDLGCEGYVRYMDDFIIFGDSKRKLFGILEEIREYMMGIRLILHPRKQEIFPAKNGLPFLGFYIFRDRRRLLRDGIQRFNKRLKHQMYAISAGKMSLTEFKQSLMSWIGHAQHGDTWRLRKKLFRRINISNP